MNLDCVVIDANIAFKTLVSQRGDLRSRLQPSGQMRFYAPGYLFVELLKHKERLARAMKLTEDEVLQAAYALVGQLEFINEAGISLGNWMEAHRLCKGVDEKDTPYIALALHLDARLWTDDNELKHALVAKGFTRFLET